MSARFTRAMLPAAAVLCPILACGGNPQPVYDSPPTLANRDEITAAMAAVGAGLEARVVLQLRIDEHGYVQDVRVSRSSGNEELDDAATWIGEQMRFEPARHEGRAIAALVEVPVTFDVVKQWCVHRDSERATRRGYHRPRLPRLERYGSIPTSDWDGGLGG